jgi:hypothetical protein
MKKILFALAAQLLFVLGAQAQFQLPESHYVSQMRMKTLLVALEEESTSTLKQLQYKPDEMKAYKAGVAKYNEMLKSAVDKYWKIGKGVEYMTRSKADQELKNGSTKYIELALDNRNGIIDPTMFGKIYGGGDYTNEIRQLSKKAGFGVYRLKVGNKGQEPDIIYSVFIPVLYPSQGDMVYAVRMMNNQLEKAMKDHTYTDPKQFEDDVKKNNKILKSKTLLLSTTQVDPKTTVDELRKAYAASVQEVDFPKVDEAIQNGDSTYAFVMIVPGGEKGTKVNAERTPIVHLVIDAATNNVIGVALPTRMEYGQFQTDITKKEIKDYLVK